MERVNGIKMADMDAVNSVFVSFETAVVISVDNDSIRIWDPVKGLEIYVADIDDSEDSVNTCFSSIFDIKTLAPVEA